MSYRIYANVENIGSGLRRHKKWPRKEKRVCYYRYRLWTKKKEARLRGIFVDIGRPRNEREHDGSRRTAGANTSPLVFPALFSAFNLHPFSPWPYSLIFSRHYRFTEMSRNVWIVLDMCIFSAIIIKYSIFREFYWENKITLIT